MTTIEVTKAQIIKAIKKEPLNTLRAGSWVKVPYGHSKRKTKLSDKICEVCAVGAVFRNILSQTTKADDLFGIIGSAISDQSAVATRNNGSLADVRIHALRPLKNGQTLAALSTYFEGAWDYYARRSGFYSIVEDEAPKVSIYAPEDMKAKAARLLKSGKYKERYKHDGLTRAEIKQVREKTAAFVKKHFPETMQIYIGDGRPSHSVTRIRQV